MVDPARIAHILGGEQVLRQPVRGLADLEAAVAQGLPVRALEESGWPVSWPSPKRSGRTV